VETSRRRRIIAELAAQPRDVHVQRLGGPPPLAVPDLPHDLLTGDHLPRVTDQHAQQVELFRGELEFRIADPGPPGIPIDPDTLHDVGLRGTAPEQRADPGQQFGEPERLRHVVVGPCVEADHGVHLVRAGGEDQHRHGLTVGAQPAAHFQPVEAGQPDVEHDQVDAPGQSHFERPRPVRRHVDVVPLTAQRPRQRL
jgi:hypothetical protein